jgi:hypothetical protein
MVGFLFVETEELKMDTLQLADAIVNIVQGAEYSTILAALKIAQILAEKQEIDRTRSELRLARG